VLRSGRSAYDWAGEALAALLHATEVRKSDIDGFCATASISEACNPFFAANLTELFGLTLDWMHLASIGGASFLSGVAAAAAAIRDARCRMAVVLGADAPSTANRMCSAAYMSEFQEPVGLTRPPEAFGFIMKVYEARHGLRYEALAKIATTQRAGALLNPNAVANLKQPLTQEHYLSSRMIADPLRLLDSVMFCDGANAVLVTTEQEARSRGMHKVVRIVSYSERSNQAGSEMQPDILETGFRVAGRRALERAGLAPSDVDMLQAYDDFTIAVLLQLEEIGFCAPGEGSDFVLSTDISYRGSLPLNTGGGQLSAGQAGLASGGLPLIEAVRQLRGEAGARQLDKASNALVTGIGGIPHGCNWMMSNAMVLEAL
jgi:acetyl-CoA acetyltransferase